MLERLPSDLEHHALLGIDPAGLARADREELGIEARDIGQKSASTRGTRHHLGVGGRLGFGPSARGHLAHGVPATSEQAPEVLGSADVAGQPATDSDDRHRIFGAARRAAPTIDRTLADERRREPPNRRVVPDQRAREWPVEQILETSGELDGVAGGQAVVDQRPIDLDLVGREPATLTNRTGQPPLELRDRDPGGAHPFDSAT